MPRKQNKQAKIARPLGVTMLSIVGVVLGLLALAGAFASGLVANTAYAAHYHALLALLAPLLVVLAVIYFLLSYGLWTGERWGWYGTVILSIIGIVLDLLRIFSHPARGVIGIIICGIVILYLTRPKPRRYFKV